jgi:hypothetical protein
MLDRLLEIGSGFDWITPLAAFAQDALNGPPAHFGIPPGAGWTRRDVAQLLHGHGVRVWGFILASDVLMFSVPKTQARWALYLLQHAGVPILHAPAAAIESQPSHKAGRPAQVVRRQARRTKTHPVDALFDFLDRLGGRR